MTSTNEFGYTPSTGFTPMEAGDYDAVLQGIIVMGRQPRTFEGKPKPPQVRLKFVFEIPDLVREGSSDSTAPKETSTTSYKVWLSDSLDKGGFAKALRALGENPTKDSIMGYMSQAGLTPLLGRGIVLTVKQFEGEKGVSACVETLTKLHAKIAIPVATRPIFYFNPMMPDIEVFNKLLSYYTKKEVMGAVNSEQFPKELHAAWVVAQEQQLAKDAERNGSSSKSTGNANANSTESIE